MDAQSQWEEIETLRRRAAADAAHRPELAGALSGLAGELIESERWPEAVTAGQEAVDLWRRLAQEEPELYTVDLSISLMNLSGALDEAGRPEDGLAAAEEAVEVRRRLAERDPQSRPILVAALHNLTVSLVGLGRPHEAHATAEEGVALGRWLMQDEPGEHRQELADALNDLAYTHGELGRGDDALAAIAEAVTLYRGLDPEALAQALSDLAVWATESGRPAEAAAALEEASELYRRLAADDPETHRENLAAALEELAIVRRALPAEGR